MAWAVLQQAAANSGASNVTSQSVTFSTANLTAGTKIICAFSCSGTSSITSIKDGAGNALTALGTIQSGGLERTALYAMDTPPGDVGTKPTITAVIGTANEVALLVLEVAGLLPGNSLAMLDGGVAAPSASGATSTNATSPSYSSTAANEFLISVYGDDGGPITYTSPSGYTDSSTGLNSDSHRNLDVAWKNSAGGSETAVWARTGTSCEWGVLLVAFRAPVRVSNSFETGPSSGTAITPSNSGSGADTPFDLTGASGNEPVITTDAAHGSKAALVNTASAANSYLQYTSNGPFGAQITFSFRFYCKISANPGAQIRLHNSTTGGGSLMTVGLSTSGKLAVSYSGTGTAFVTFTASVPIGTWFRVEGFVVVSATVGQVSASLYSSGMENGVPDETHTSTASLAVGTLSGTTSYSLADSSTVAMTSGIEFDDWVLDTAGPVGPVVPAVLSLGTPTLASAAFSTTSQTVTATWGPGQNRTAGNLLLGMVTVYGTTTGGLGTAPSGWALVNSVTGSSRAVTGYYTRTAAGGDSAPVFNGTETGTAADATIACVMYELQDPVPGSTPYVYGDGTATGTSGTITPATSFNVPAAGCAGIAGAVAGQGTTAATTTWTTPSGWTLSGSQTASACSQMASYAITPASGSVLSCLFTHSRTSTFQSAIVLVVVPAVTPPPMTVTATQGVATDAGMLMRVKVLTGAASASAQAGGAAASSTATNVSVTTTAAASVVYGALTSDGTNAWTAEAGTTLIDNFNDATHDEFYGSFRTTSPTGTPGAVTVGVSTANIFPGVAAQEILAAGTIAEDASAPPVATTTTATTLTSPLFSPPPGSLIVVMIGCDGTGSGSAETCTVTDTGGGLTWTQMAHTTAAGSLYAGVWIAQVPPSAAAPLPGATMAVQAVKRSALW